MRVNTLTSQKESAEIARQAPRVLSTKQKSDLNGVLRRLKKFPLTVGYVSSDNEARAFASDLLEIFKSSGWAVDFRAFMDIHGDGVIVSAAGTANNKPARNIHRVLRAVGIPNALESSPPELRFPVLLFIGHKNPIR
jgi:hypothetical protein